MLIWAKGGAYGGAYSAVFFVGARRKGVASAQRSSFTSEEVTPVSCLETPLDPQSLGWEVVQNLTDEHAY